MRLSGVPLSVFTLIFQSTHPARGATPHVGQRPVQQAISIHAPREGCDRLYLMALFGTYNNFNPRTPRGVRRPAAWFKIGTGPFQSTHPARGATPACPVEAQGVESFQSTHPARGATICHWSTDNLDITISIHAPREGCDISLAMISPLLTVFQSTHPARGATTSSCVTSISSLFQSTHPARGATEFAVGLYSHHLEFQSTHPARGATYFLYAKRLLRWNFNPRTPRGVRLQPDGVPVFVFISIHAPREGCDSAFDQYDYGNRISIHAPREGCDSRISTHCCVTCTFQSTHPARGATANFTKEQRVCLAQFAYLHKGKKAEHTKTNAPMLHEAFLYAFWVRTGRRRRVLLDFARYKIKGSSGR